jgi:predicted oxidoreductase
MGGESVDVVWAEKYIRDSSAEVYSWCERLGVVWDEIGQPEGNSVPRWHVPRGWGAGIVELCLNRAIECGVEVRTGATVHAIRPSSTGTPRIEVGTSRLDADAVVVCAGGFAGSLDRVLELAPELNELPRLLSGSSPTSTGAGLDLLAGVGAQTVNLDHLWIYPTGTPDPSDTSGRRGLGVRGIDNGIWLNRDGHRFHDENLSGGRSGTAALLRQPGCTSWLVFPEREIRTLMLIDNEYYASPAGPRPDAVQEFIAQSPYVTRAETILELADAVGLRRETSLESVNLFDSAVRAGAEIEPEFGRAIRGLAPISDGPVVAIQLFPMAQKNLGGARTDLDCAVLDSAGSPIPGVYAAGEVAGMAGGSINGGAALEGTMFGPALYSGRIAGRAASRSRETCSA